MVAQCPWSWHDGVLTDGGERALADSVRVIDTDGDAAPDLLADLGGCGNHGDCLFAVLQSCQDGSFLALWGPEYAQSIQVVGLAPLQLRVGGRSGQAGCDVPSRQSLGWVDDRWQDQGTCYGAGLWEPEECGEMPQPTCAQDEGVASLSRCDVKMIAGFWKMDQGQARAQIENKLSGGYGEIIDFDLVGAKTLASASCSPEELGFSSADVAVLQTHLGEEVSAEEALFQAYREDALRTLTRTAGVPSAIEPAVVLKQEGYTACDAKQLAAFWGGNVEAAVTMRDKLLRGQKETVNAELRAAYANGAEVQCAWHETGFDAVQISQVSKAWGLTPDVAALRVAELVSTGQHAQVLRSLP